MEAPPTFPKVGSMAVANTTFTLAGTPVGPGKVSLIHLNVTRLSTGTEVHVPVTVVNGAFEGPRLLLTGAIHGDEMNGVEIVRQVVQDVDPKRLHGTIVAVPVVNVLSYLIQSRYLPDRRDLNRHFPGNLKGSLAAQLAHMVMTKIVPGATFAVDFHAGSDGRTNLPQIRADLGNPHIRSAALAFGAPVALHAKIRPGSFRWAANQIGLPMLLFEGGEALRFERPVIKVGVEGTWRLMQSLGMHPGGVEELPRDVFVAGDSAWVRAPAGGLFHTATHPGDFVKKGERLGVVMDVQGRSTGRVVAPFQGLVVGMVVNPQVAHGEALLHIARAEADCPPRKRRLTDD